MTNYNPFKEIKNTKKMYLLIIPIIAIVLILLSFTFNSKNHLESLLTDWWADIVFSFNITDNSSNSIKNFILNYINDDNDSLINISNNLFDWIKNNWNWSSFLLDLDWAGVISLFNWDDVMWVLSSIAKISASGDMWKVINNSFKEWLSIRTGNIDKIQE